MVSGLFSAKTVVHLSTAPVTASFEHAVAVCTETPALNRSATELIARRVFIIFLPHFIYSRTWCLRKKSNAKPVAIVTSAIRIMASNDPSPWSGEKPNHLSMKSTWLHSPEKQATIPYVTCWCRVNLRLLKLDLGPTASAYRSYCRPPLPRKGVCFSPKSGHVRGS